LSAIASYETSIEEINTQIAAILKETEDAEAKIDAMSEELESIVEELSDLEESIEERISEKEEELEAIADALEEKYAPTIEKLEDRIEKLEDKFDNKLSKRLNRIANQLAKLQSRMDLRLTNEANRRAAFEDHLAELRAAGHDENSKEYQRALAKEQRRILKFDRGTAKLERRIERNMRTLDSSSRLQGRYDTEHDRREAAAAHIAGLTEGTAEHTAAVRAEQKNIARFDRLEARHNRLSERANKRHENWINRQRKGIDNVQKRIEGMELEVEIKRGATDPQSEHYSDAFIKFVNDVRAEVGAEMEKVQARQTEVEELLNTLQTAFEEIERINEERITERESEITIYENMIESAREAENAHRNNVDAARAVVDGRIADFISRGFITG